MLDAALEIIATGRVSSQRDLARSTLAALGRDGRTYRLSPERARKVAAKGEAVRIRVQMRRSSRTMSSCPLCGAELERVETKDLFGSSTKGGSACPQCDFTVDPGRRSPARYTFELRW